MAETDHTAHPIGWSVYDVAARFVDDCSRRDSTDMREIAKRNGITEDEIEVSADCWQ